MLNRPGTCPGRRYSGSETGKTFVDMGGLSRPFEICAVTRLFFLCHNSAASFHKFDIIARRIAGAIAW